MALGQLKRLAGPAYIANAAADILTTPNALIYHVVNQIHIVNKTALTATFTLYLGATGGSAGGTEIGGGTQSVPANSSVDIFFSPGLKIVNTEYLSGVAGTASALVITIMGTQAVV